MKKSRIIAVVVLVLAIAGGWIYFRTDRGGATSYRFATVERGDVVATVSATGNLEAVTTVQVGTQVSGQISAIYVDFNDQVRKGQLLARIDPVLQQQAVEEARAGLTRAQATYDAAKREYDRNKALFDQQIVTATEFNSANAAYQVASANVTSARIALERARQNLAYTSIYSPINGVVVERNVDVGQTVAASLQAPQLFLIANDLSRLQILASVDESDIGSIVEGQPVRFTVQAYPSRTFSGTVRQVRLQSTTTENVVNYTAVVEVANSDGKLLPGMTATVDFLTGSAENVLMVPNAALRFRATEEMLAEVGQQPASMANAGETARTRVTSTSGGAIAARDTASTRRGTGARAATSATGTRAAGGTTTLWYVDKAGKLGTVRVRTGLTDGQRTEVRGEGLEEGMRIVVGVTESGGNGAAAASPFQTQGAQRRPGGF